MKKLIATCALATIMTAPAQADTVLGFYIGGQYWKMDTEGGFAQNESIADFNFEEQNSSSFYAALEHPIPLIPNVKIIRTSLDTDGSTQLDGTFTFGDEVYPAGTRLETVADLTATDYILYYEILDNDLISFDLGLSGKQVDGDFLVRDPDTLQSSRETFDEIIPMAYSRVAIGLPLTGLGVYAEGSFLAIDDNKFLDYQAAITYNFVESLAIDMTIQAGYRAVSVDLDDIDDVYADIDFKGPFVGIEFDF